MRKIFFALILSFVFFIFSYNVTHSYFTDSAVSDSNIFKAAEQFPISEIPTPTIIHSNSNTIVINEIYPHGDSNAEWVELYNKSSNEINVSGWKISDKEKTDTLPSVTPIPAGGYAVIVAPTNNPILPEGVIKIQIDGAIGNGLSVPGDHLSLKLPNDTEIDTVNWGTSTFYFSPAVNSPANDKTISRNPNGQDTGSATDWISNATATLGLSN